MHEYQASHLASLELIEWDDWTNNVWNIRYYYYSSWISQSKKLTLFPRWMILIWLLI